GKRPGVAATASVAAGAVHPRAQGAVLAGDRQRLEERLGEVVVALGGDQQPDDVTRRGAIRGRQPGAVTVAYLGADLAGEPLDRLGAAVGGPLPAALRPEPLQQHLRVEVDRVLVGGADERLDRRRIVLADRVTAAQRSRRPPDLDLAADPDAGVAEAVPERFRSCL